jgi:hypothetical protein
MTPRKRPARLDPGAARVPIGSILRLILFALLAIGGAAWGLVRHLTRVQPPMTVPAAAPAYDADAGELPVPDLLE